MKFFSAFVLALFALPYVMARPTDGGLDPSAIVHPSPDSWPTYNGDYSGRRFSPLTKINDHNVEHLSLAWMYELSGGGDPPGGRISATPLVVNGVMYFTVPDKAWAIDARTGREIWTYAWTSKGGIHLGNRGVGISGHSLFFETPDCNLVALDVNNGKKLWNQAICDLDQMYYASVAPVVVKNHVIVGVSGDDLDRPGYLEARDPETGQVQWHWSAVPKPGEPGSETWPNADAMEHGGGMTWVPSTYDPELNMLFVGTGNPQPVAIGKGRAGSNLFTESIVALNADTGKLIWYFQPSPHDTHDWDAVQTPVLFDGEIKGQRRKLVAQASRNGWFFVLDRETGKNYVSSQFVKTNWAKGLDDHGEPIPNPAKEPQVAGALVSPNQGGAVNWPPPTFSPQTGLFYVNATRAFSLYYVYDTSEKAEGWGGNDQGGWGNPCCRRSTTEPGQLNGAISGKGRGSAAACLAPRATWSSQVTQVVTSSQQMLRPETSCGTLI